ncbi:MAG: putative rane protein [Pedosphaera sp.]|nr:putative rane protein [Pedosphaera sp.]
MNFHNAEQREAGSDAREAVLGEGQTNVLAFAAWHSLAWLVISNGIGLLLGLLLLFPQLNHWLGEWTYGRWMPLHLNLNLYGWCSLPLVVWLLRFYQADCNPAARWSRTALWAWSTALAIGAISWLTGHSSGKLFLDWQGYARMLFALAMLVLWLVLAWSLCSHWRAGENLSRILRAAKIAGLVLLLCVPFALYWAASPKVYPPVNPDTGGPTGNSLLESTLGIILILLVLPYGTRRPARAKRRAIAWAWILFAAENLLCLALGRGNSSHHQRSQILGLGSLLIWMPLLPAYFNSFDWPAETKRWRNACLFWWGLLVVSAWLVFLPGLLDRFKFTDALVGHSHMAMAGFISSLNIFLLVTLLEEDGRRFNSTWAFFAWQAGTLGYIVIMFLAGWLEGNNPGFTIIPGVSRDIIYVLRLGCGGLMTAAAIYWWQGLSLMDGRKPELQRKTILEGRLSYVAPSRAKIT